MLGRLPQEVLLTVISTKHTHI